MFKKTGLISLVVVGACGAVLYYYWSQIIALPDWYTKQVNPEQALSKIEPNSQQQQIENSGGEIKLDQQNLNKLLVTTLAENQQNHLLLNATKGVNTTIENGKVEIGAVVNTSEISVASLSSTEKTILNQALTTFPVLKNKDVYVAIEGKLGVENGQLQLDENTKVKVGNLSMNMMELSQMLGISPEAARQQLELKLKQWNISDIKFLDSEALVKGSVN